jgi:Fe-S-cluster-containing hydrogenase component 2
MDVCPVGAISRDEETGAIVLDQDLCIGCNMCLTVCPLGGISVDPETGTIIKCDLCQGDPECVKHCVYGALEFVKASEAGYIRRREGVKNLFKIKMLDF